MEPDVVLTEGASTFVEAVREALAQGSEADQARRKRLAHHNTWDKRTERLLELVRQELEKSLRAA
jgi:gamma-glutamyl:cysteine ligase YbdK (ATP-grasp superfamily)